MEIDCNCKYIHNIPLQSKNAQNIHITQESGVESNKKRFLVQNIHIFEIFAKIVLLRSDFFLKSIESQNLSSPC